LPPARVAEIILAFVDKNPIQRQPMLAAVSQFVLAALVIIAAGVLLTRSADAIAEQTKLGRLLVGSIFLAAATSLPELLVDINAVRMQLADLAVGDLMGSSLFNLLILAVFDLWRRSQRSMLTRASAAHALSGTVSIALTALAALGILVSPRMAGAQLAGIGVSSLLILVGYALCVRMIYYDQRFSAALARPDEPGFQAAPHMSLKAAAASYVASAGVILVAAPYLAEAAGKIADLSGLGKTFVGTTLVAFSTSLPELVATLAAVRMGAFDLAIGNIFGSNTFNMALLVPLDIVHAGPILAAVSPVHVVTACATILVTAVAVMGQLYQIEKRVLLLEPDAVLIILLIIGSLGLIYYLGDG
jgi:cation:H+ antiporter